MYLREIRFSGVSEITAYSLQVFELKAQILPQMTNPVFVLIKVGREFYSNKYTLVQIEKQF